MEEKSISNDASILYFLGKMEETAVLKSIVNNNLLKDNRNKRNLEIFEVQDESKIIYPKYFKHWKGAGHYSH